MVGADAAGPASLTTFDGGRTWIAGDFPGDAPPPSLLDVAIVP